MLSTVQIQAQKKVKGKRADYWRISMDFVSLVVVGTMF